MQKKTAIILLNLGGPDRKESIKPFLMNFFMDKNIIGAPKPIRFLIASLIANKRSKAEALENYAKLGFCSPLLANTQKQAEALQAILPENFKVYVSMRYWHPRADAVIDQVIADGMEQIILLPLYPQFSTTTTGSSVQEWQNLMQNKKTKIPTKLICCYPYADGFLQASLDHIETTYRAMAKEAKALPRMLFSAHGLPEKIIKAGDPYQHQCEQSAQKMADLLALRIGDLLQGQPLDWQICYQSRVGPLKWIGPSTEEALQKVANDQKAVVIYPHAFVSEHVQTLVEIEDEYREVAEHMGIHHFARVSTVMDNSKFIQGLKEAIDHALAKQNYSESDSICGSKCTYKKCAVRLFKDCEGLKTAPFSSCD